MIILVVKHKESTSIETNLIIWKNAIFGPTNPGLPYYVEFRDAKHLNLKEFHQNTTTTCWVDHADSSGYSLSLCFYLFRDSSVNRGVPLTDVICKSAILSTSFSSWPSMFQYIRMVYCFN